MRKYALLLASTLLVTFGYANMDNDAIQISVECQKVAIKLGMSQSQIIDACGQPQNVDQDHENGQSVTELTYVLLKGNQRTAYDFEFNAQHQLTDIEVTQQYTSDPY